jgi:hypothetical protein
MAAREDGASGDTAPELQTRCVFIAFATGSSVPHNFSRSLAARGRVWTVPRARFYVGVSGARRLAR